MQYEKDGTSLTAAVVLGTTVTTPAVNIDKSVTFTLYARL